MLSRDNLRLLLVFSAMAVRGVGAASLPSVLIENRGQYPEPVAFALQNDAFSAAFRSSSVEYRSSGAGATGSIRVRFLSYKSVRPVGSQRLSGSVNYLLGPRPSAWTIGAGTYAALSYPEQWPGIDILYSVKTGALKSEFQMAPGADPAMVRWQVEGAEAIELATDGSLTMRRQGQELHEAAPTAYEEDRATGRRRAVSGAFRLLPGLSVGIEVGAYDQRNRLIFDPVIGYSTFFGGTGQSAATAIAVDTHGNVVVAGNTTSLNMVSQASLSGPGGRSDVFVAKLNAAGNELIFCTYLGGSLDDNATALALDRWNNVYVAGSTASSDFPAVSALQPKRNGSRDAFIAQLNSSGSDLVFSTFLGGSASQQATAIRVDRFGSIYVAGNTQSADFPMARPFQGTLGGGQDAFLVKMGFAGSRLIYSSYLGGASDEYATGLAVDGAGAATVVGSTLSSNFPVANAFQGITHGYQNAFITKFSPAGAALVFSTYLGGSGGAAGLPETAAAVTTDSAGSLYIAGTTSSLDFPVTAGAFQGVSPGGLVDAFAAKLSSAGALVYSTFLGGSGVDYATAIAVDAAGNAHLAGYSLSVDFPVIRGVQAANGGSYDLFVTKLNAAGTAVLYSTQLGGALADSAAALALDRFGAVLIAGQTFSANFPVSGAYQAALTAPASAIIARLPIGWKPALFSNGVWSIDYLRNGGSDGLVTNFATASFGLPGDIPVVGDWSGNGSLYLGVFRNGTWYLDSNGNDSFDLSDRVFTFGQAGDIPVVGDWDGSGTVKAGLYRNGTFILDLSGHLSGIPTGQSDATFPFGLPTDVPVIGDWNGSGTAKVGVFRGGQWLLDFNGDQMFNGADETKVYGRAGDWPLVGDWDGSGQSKPGLYRNGSFLLDYNGNWNIDAFGDLTVPFGPATQYALMAR